MSYKSDWTEPAKLVKAIPKALVAAATSAAFEVICRTKMGAKRPDVSLRSEHTVKDNHC